MVVEQVGHVVLDIHKGGAQVDLGKVGPELMEEIREFAHNLRFFSARYEEFRIFSRKPGKFFYLCENVFMSGLRLSPAGKTLALILFLPMLMSACRQRPQTEAIPGAEIRPAAFEAEFSAQPVPPEVEARMRGRSYPDGARIALSELRYLRLSHYDFDGNPRTGEMVCNAAIAADLCEIFRALYEAEYPIASIRLVDDFEASDEASMAADNTSCFNYRTIPGQARLSNHARGLAVDVNPLENPYVGRNGRVRPAGGEAFADRTADFPHKIDREDLCYRLFRAHGFSWGGAWARSRDYQHFEKAL